MPVEARPFEIEGRAFGEQRPRPFVHALLEGNDDDQVAHAAMLPWACTLDALRRRRQASVRMSSAATNVAGCIQLT